MTPGQRIRFTDTTGRTRTGVVRPHPDNPLMAGYVLVMEDDDLPTWARADNCEVIG